MIDRYRNRGKYIEFDWREGGCVLKFLRFFPKWDKIYPHKAASEHKRGAYYYTYELDEPLGEAILAACKDKFVVVNPQPKG
jgi:hypothetical protein